MEMVRSRGYDGKFKARVGYGTCVLTSESRTEGFDVE